MMLRSVALALALFLLGPTDAFVPTSSSFVQNRKNVGTHQLSPTPSKTALIRTASVSMNMRSPRNLVDLHNMFVYFARPDLALTDHLVRAAKANMKNAVQSIDSKSPENVINRALQEMQNDLLKIKQAYAEAVDTQRRIVMQKRQVEAVADDYYRRAAYALRRGYERTAKEALSQRQKYLETANNLQVQLDAQSVATERLYEGMKAIEMKFHDALEKRTELISRAKTAQSVKKVNDMLSGMTGDTSFDAFDRIEEKVEAMEAEADMSAEQILKERSPPQSDDRLEMEFENLKNSAAIEDEYEKLKQELKKSIGGKSFKTDAEIEEDLAKLGRRVIESGYF